MAMYYGLHIKRFNAPRQAKPGSPQKSQVPVAAHAQYLLREMPIEEHLKHALREGRASGNVMI